uniref:Uncharacterized protein n=1 Tax=Romanomermis culicivorax TaxID=13658 RepID=A0A915K047_ROMCU
MIISSTISAYYPKNLNLPSLCWWGPNESPLRLPHIPLPNLNLNLGDFGFMTAVEAHVYSVYARFSLFNRLLK